ncbi:uncharacterized protein LOC125047103 [Penaeus chinensis]|uniref:uncharacterized protein LOC125047103 n=1 Tax=Penaeus chinensis TaxID=139456 RepID=UPI001FB7AA1B|nr:uncharacterized protein LOC125047103 [Penaeus chinensis]
MSLKPSKPPLQQRDGSLVLIVVSHADEKHTKSLEQEEEVDKPQGTQTSISQLLPASHKPVAGVQAVRTSNAKQETIPEEFLAYFCVTEERRSSCNSERSDPEWPGSERLGSERLWGQCRCSERPDECPHHERHEREQPHPHYERHRSQQHGYERQPRERHGNERTDLVISSLALSAPAGHLDQSASRCLLALSAAPRDVIESADYVVIGDVTLPAPSAPPTSRNSPLRRRPSAELALARRSRRCAQRVQACTAPKAVRQFSISLPLGARRWPQHGGAATAGRNIKGAGGGRYWVGAAGRSTPSAAPHSRDGSGSLPHALDKVSYRDQGGPRQPLYPQPASPLRGALGHPRSRRGRAL